MSEYLQTYMLAFSSFLDFWFIPFCYIVTMELMCFWLFILYLLIGKVLIVFLLNVSNY